MRLQQPRHRRDQGVADSEVPRGAAGMVLADDNLATVDAAVGQGRWIYDNVGRFARYILTSMSGEIWVRLISSPRSSGCRCRYLPVQSTSSPTGCPASRPESSGPSAT